jgi:hypothetical protein
MADYLRCRKEMMMMMMMMMMMIMMVEIDGMLD